MRNANEILSELKEKMKSTEDLLTTYAKEERITSMEKTFRKMVETHFRTACIPFKHDIRLIAERSLPPSFDLTATERTLLRAEAQAQTAEAALARLQQSTTAAEDALAALDTDSDADSDADKEDTKKEKIDPENIRKNLSDLKNLYKKFIDAHNSSATAAKSTGSSPS